MTDGPPVLVPSVSATGMDAAPEPGTGPDISVHVTASLSAPAGPERPLHIALVGEGAYPIGPGGVSLWCHQLIEGMPQNSFTAVAISEHRNARSMWDRPGNLRETVVIPIWETRPPRRRGPVSEAFDEAHAAFLAALLAPETGPDEAPSTAFEDALRAFIACPEGADLSAAFTSNASIDRTLAAWRRAEADGLVKGRLTVRDAMVASDRFEHMLRALTHPPLQVDVCHLSMSGISALVALRSKWEYGTPVVLSEHGVYLRERYLGLREEQSSGGVKTLTLRFHRALNEAAYRAADVLAPHSTFNRRWQLRGGGDVQRIQTMYNGINPADFPVADAEPEEPTIVFVGRIDRIKDLHTLIRAFALVQDSIPEARLRMFGPVSEDQRDYYVSCLALIHDLKLEGKALFEGRIPSTVDAYQSGHVVALTSVSEGFPFTIVESMSMGRPPVATNVGGVSEAVGDAGIVVPPRDHEAVAEACVRLLTDGDLRRAMGLQARARVLDRFTLQQWTDAYRDIYLDLTTPKDAAPPSVMLGSAGERIDVLELRHDVMDLRDDRAELLPSGETTGSAARSTTTEEVR